jgi:ABC-type sugar transport system ATPase subunit
MIELKDITLIRDNRFIFEAFNLTISNKERLVIMGESGSGKSTLLRLIAGFITPSHGEITINNKSVTYNTRIEVEPHQRDIGMIFQDLALWPHLSVSGNIAFGLKIQKTSKSEQKHKVTEMLHLVGLDGYEDRVIDSLSGGEQQRVALARALVLSPKILLMDEPLSSLDIKRNKILRQEIVRLQEKLGFTLVYVTHNQEEAQAIGTNILNLERES